MKKIILLSALALALTSCTSDYNTNTPAESLPSNSLQITPGLEDCSIYSHSVYVGSNYPIYIVRCEGVTTTTVNKVETHGKTRVNRTHVTINGATKPKDDNIKADLVIDGVNYIKIDTSAIIEVNGQKYIKM